MNLKFLAWLISPCRRSCRPIYCKRPTPRARTVKTEQGWYLEAAASGQLRGCTSAIRSLSHGEVHPTDAARPPSCVLDAHIVSATLVQLRQGCSV